MLFTDDGDRPLLWDRVLGEVVVSTVGSIDHVDGAARGAGVELVVFKDGTEVSGLLPAAEDAF